MGVPLISGAACKRQRPVPKRPRRRAAAVEKKTTHTACRVEALPETRWRTGTLAASEALPLKRMALYRRDAAAGGPRGRAASTSDPYKAGLFRGGAMTGDILLERPRRGGASVAEKDHIKGRPIMARLAERFWAGRGELWGARGCEFWR